MANLDLLTRRIEKIHLELGGDTSDIQAGAKKDQFIMYKNEFQEAMENITKYKEDKAQLLKFKSQEDPGALKLKYRLLIEVRRADELLVRLTYELQKQRKKPRKYNSTDIEAKELYLNSEITKLNRVKEEEEMNKEVGIARPSAIRSGKIEGPILMEQIHLQEDARTGPLADVELTAKNRWLEMDIQIDNLADRIGENVIELKGRAQGINENLDHQQVRMEKLENNIDLTNKDLETSTKKMKKLLAKIREGDKFCVTICLLLVLIGLVTVGYSMISG